MVIDRLMRVLHWLRSSQQKPLYIEQLDRRQDAVEERLRVLTPDSANRAQQLVKGHR